MNMNPYPPGGPLWGLIKFLAMVGLLTIFIVGIAIGYYLAYGGF